MQRDTSANSHSRQVAVLVETDDSWGCSVIRGIADYAQNIGHWHLLIDPKDPENRSSLPDLWAGDGIIARLGSRQQVEQVRRRNVPVVNVDSVYENLPGVADVVTDDAARATLALEHLRDRGFENFAYFAPPSPRYSDKRGKEFVSKLEEEGYRCDEYRPGYRAGRKIGWGEQQRRVSKWLSTLPRPVAILAVDAHRGRQLAEICHMSGIRVPDEVAILAGDTDDLMCEVSSPPLSSVAVARVLSWSTILAFPLCSRSFARTCIACPSCRPMKRCTTGPLAGSSISTMP